MVTVLASLIPQTGCVLANRSIVATVRDPAAVSVSVGTNEVIAGDGEPRSVPVAAGTFSTGASASSSYQLHVDRLPDKSLRLRWVQPPIVGGELYTLLPADGHITILDTADANVVQLDDSRLRIPLLASLSSASDSDGGFIGYRASVGPTQPPGASVSVPLSLDTPLANLLEVRRKVSPRRGVALAVFLGSTVFFGAFGAAYIASAPSFGKGTSGEAAFRGVGWGSVAAGGLVDVLMLPTLLSPSTDLVIEPKR